MPTLLDYLTIRDPGNLDRADVLTGTNTLDPLWEDIDDTREWQGFTYDNKVKMLSEILETQYLPSDLDQPAPLRQASRFITDEDSVDHVSSKWHHTIVDRALELTPIGASTMSWTRGCHDRLPNAPPDWTGTDAFSVPWKNRLSDGTKVPRKWKASMKDGPRRDHIEFFKQMRQVVYYANLPNKHEIFKLLVA